MTRKSVAIIGCLILLPLHAMAEDVCANYKAPSAFTKMRDDVDKKIATFAGKKEVASAADALLSKLITAKSPVIQSWIAKRDLDKKSDEALVREWRLYYAKNFVLTKYPQGDKAVDAALEDLVNGLLKAHIKPEFKKRMEAQFIKAQTAALETAETWGLEKTLAPRIKAIRLYWPTDLKSARNGALPLDIVDWGIAYDPSANEINMGLNALSYPNDETYLAVFAHEIGHSFDSCRWGAFFDPAKDGAWPFTAVGECLRSPKSVLALKRDDSKMEELQKSGQLSASIAEGLKANPTCNKLVYPPPGIQADQLPESFADWVSAEVVSGMKGLDFKRLRMDLCQTKPLVEGSSYPRNGERLSRIYRAHPKIAKEPSGAYCPFVSLK